MPTKAQWSEARLKYETRPDCTQKEIADELQVTRQAVGKRIKSESWIKADRLPDTLEGSNLVNTVQGSRLGLRCEENISEIVNVFALTGSRSMACAQVGIDDKTLYNWCKEEPELSRAMMAARNAELVNQVRKVSTSKDWKAAQYLLSKAPETRDQFGETRETGPKIVLNIHRDEVVIDQGS